MRRPLVGLLLALLLSGCWDNRPINSRAMVLGMGVDPGTGGDRMTFTLAVPSPANLAGLPTMAGTGPAFVTIRSEGPSLIQAVAAAAASSSRDIYLGQLQYVVLSERLPASEVTGLAETLGRIPELDLTNFVLVTSGSAGKLAASEPAQEVLPTVFLPARLACNQCQEEMLGIRAWEWLKDLLTPGRDPVLPVLSAGGKKSLRIRGLALYRRGEFRGEITGPALLGWAYIRNRVVKAAYGVRTPRGLAVIRGVRGRARLEAEMRGGRPRLGVRLSLQGTINQVPLSEHPLSAADRKLIARRAADEIRRQVAEAVAAARRLGVDPFGFGRILWYRDPRRFPPDWDRVFARTPVGVAVRIRLVGQGAAV